MAVFRYLLCSLCQQRFDFPHERCYYRLTDAPADWDWRQRGIEVLQQPVWCQICNAPRYAERLPPLRVIEMAIALKKLEQRPGGYGRAGLPEPDELVSALLRRSAGELATFAVTLRDRRPPGRCLQCGERSHIPMGWGGTPLRHQPCDAPLRLHFFSAVSSRQIVRWFDCDGRFLSEELA